LAGFLGGASPMIGDRAAHDALGEVTWLLEGPGEDP
jgi:hypothetical protein